MKFQILFSGKNKKNNIILPSAENAQRLVKVKEHDWYTAVWVIELFPLYRLGKV